jgi:hypothetical protein
MSVLSVDDAFTVGVTFDLVGGFLLGRSLLASPGQIAQRGAARWGYHSTDLIAQIRAGADGRLGLASLAVGFGLQLCGYLALIGGAPIETGVDRAALALGLAVGIAGLWWALLLAMHARIVKRLAVKVARANRTTGTLQRDPDGGVLVALGQELGYYMTEVPGPANPGAFDRYAQRYFDVSRVSRHVPTQGV